MATQDHTVPQMYLKPFGWERKAGKEWQIITRRKPELKAFTSNIDRTSSMRDFYLGKGPDGIQTHKMEKTLQTFEEAAAPVFKAMLKDRKPDKWGLSGSDKAKVADLMAAQVLRSIRQRKRIGYNDFGVIQDAAITDPKVKNRHLQYMNEKQKELRDNIVSRPWGFGFSDVGLITGDSPVVILNGHDDDDQVRSFADCSVVMPLDTDRLLFLPSPAMQSADAKKNTDHIFNLVKGAGWGINQSVFGAAETSIYHHPHLEFEKSGLVAGFDIVTPWSGADEPSRPHFDIDYDVVSSNRAGEGFERGEQFGVHWDDENNVTTIYGF